MGISITFNLRIGLRHDKEAEVFVGYCPALKIYSQGETEQEAIIATQSAVSLFIRECLKRDILRDVFKEHGLTKIEGVGAVTKERIQSEFIAIEPFESFTDVNVPIRIEKESELCQLSLS